MNNTPDDYASTLSFLYAQLPVFESIGVHAYKPGLERMEAMDERLGHPSRGFSSIHVAGTNGKGSVSHTLASILQATGQHRVGLFTSPHLLDFDERIRVDGNPIDHDYVVRWVKSNYDRMADLQPSFFELATMMAFCYFADSGVDVAVVEVGLGGRLDSTNVLMPSLSVITNISMDHTQLLGDTLPQIAAEKAGIIKHGVPCVVGECEKRGKNRRDKTNAPTPDVATKPEPSVRRVFEQKAAREGAPLYIASDNPQIAWVSHGDGIAVYETIVDGTLRSPLVGACQPKNANTVLTAIHVLRDMGWDIGADAVADGMERVVERTHLMGRWQKLGSRPFIVCDTGHNEGCFRYLGPQLRQLVDGGKQTHRVLHVVFGMVADKDVATVLGMLPAGARYYFTAAATPRALPASDLAAMASLHGLAGVVYPTTATAVVAARAAATDEDAIFIGGSNFVVAEALLALRYASQS